MDIKEWAKRLSGRECGKELPGWEADQARIDGVVIVFGASDDLMEFRGAINDELGACDGGTAFITSEGLLEGCDEDPKCEKCKYLKAERERSVRIKAIWCPETISASWLIEAPKTLPHESFDIMEDGDLYCRGIVFALADVGAVKP